MTATRLRCFAAHAACVLAAFLAACATPVAPPAAPAVSTRPDGLVPVQVSGQLIYRDRAALPPDAEVVVRLVDDHSQRTEQVVAETRFPAGGRQSPIPFSITVEPDVMNPDEPYLFRAQVLVGGKVRYVTGTRVLVRPLLPPESLSLLVVPGTQEPSFSQADAPGRGGPAPRPPPAISAPRTDRPGRPPAGQPPAPPK